MAYSRHIIGLAEPFPDRYISRKPGADGGDYVAHYNVEQRLIVLFGVPPRIEVLRELYDEGRLTGCVLRMTLSNGWEVEEGGEADNPQSKTNGARLKDAISDAYKRCAMRFGCGLHLWAQNDYFLFDHLNVEAVPATDARGHNAGQEGEQPAASTTPPMPRPWQPIRDPVEHVEATTPGNHGYRPGSDGLHPAVAEQAVASTTPPTDESGGQDGAPSRPSDEGGTALPPLSGSVSSATCMHAQWKAAPRAGFELCSECGTARKAS